MMNKELTIDMPIKAEFYDVDSMNIVWHGNYLKYYEQARCALLDKIGYNYNEMKQSGYAWPVVKIELKYMRPIEFNQEFRIKATLKEYENRIAISYLIYDLQSGKKINRGRSTQMALDIKTGESLFVSPKVFTDRVIKLLEELEDES
ncbi:MAG: acyl-CoA thioesterase [Spirochaetaceae bacterium]|nr:acyl-CoA thioesterase [Spirochaetaceae bacterium]